MMNTVAPVAIARNTARYVFSPSALNASSGPYADDDRPSAPSPTHARNATSDMWWNTLGSRRFLPLPSSQRGNFRTLHAYRSPRIDGVNAWGRRVKNASRCGELGYVDRA